MDKVQRNTYNVFLQVRGFGLANRQLLPESSKGDQLLGVVDQAIAEIERQSSARLDARREGHQTAEARRALKQWMLDIARVSRDIARTKTLAVPSLTMPTRRNDAALLAAADSFLKVGATFSDELVQRGLDEQWADAFKKAMDALATRRDERMAGRRGGKDASSAIEKALQRGLDALKTLDGIVDIALRKEPVLRPSWEQARRIPRPVRGAKESAPAEVLVDSGEGGLVKAS